MESLNLALFHPFSDYRFLVEVEKGNGGNLPCIYGVGIGNSRGAFRQLFDGVDIGINLCINCCIEIEVAIFDVLVIGVHEDGSRLLVVHDGNPALFEGVQQFLELIRSMRLRKGGIDFLPGEEAPVLSPGNEALKDGQVSLNFL